MFKFAMETECTESTAFTITLIEVLFYFLCFEKTYNKAMH